MKKKHLIYTAILLLSFIACKNNENKYDASGSFEAVETIIAAETNGKILQLNILEGQELKADQVIGYIDSTQLYLTKLQLMQNKKAVLSGRPVTMIQTKSLKEQLTSAKMDQQRIGNLVKGGVANQKQLDDANARVATIEAQISAQESSLKITTTSINEQANVLDVQLREINDQLAKCKITNPVNGTVLSKYAESFEMAVAGRPIYKIADLSNITLRAYITGYQLTQVKLNQKVNVLTDNGKGGYKSTSGTVFWISDKSEFTPKSIHTQKERANLVYAIKVRVPNDGTYKIGMYGEIKF